MNQTEGQAGGDAGGDREGDTGGQIIIRSARAEDAAGILRMQRELCGMHLSLDPERFVVPADIDGVYRRWLARAEPGSELLALVAEAHAPGAKGGLLAYMIAEAMPAHAEYWSPACVYIHDIYVDPAARGSAIGAELASRAEAWARSRNITQVRGLVAMGNAPAQAFFQRLGFRLATVEACKEL